MKIYRKILKNAAIGLSIILAATSFPAFEIDSFAEDTPSIAAALETDVLWGDVNKDGIVNSKDATDLAAAISKGTASAMLWADVSGDGKITNKDVGLINSYANEEIGYFPVGIFYAEGQVYTTKEMWIHNLVTTFNISVEDKSTMTEYFTDISDSKYKDDINLAANYGVVDVAAEEFEPASYVTREFASYTLNYCLGFSIKKSLYCSDSDEVYYQDDAAVALEKKWFELNDNKFMPDLYVLEPEVKTMMSFAQEIVDSAVIDPNHKNVAEFNDGVIKFGKDIKTSLDVENETITLLSDEAAVADGNIFTCFIDGKETPIKAKSVSYDIKGYPIVVIDKISLSEVYDKLEVEGIGDIDYDNVTTYFEEDKAKNANNASTYSTLNQPVTYLASGKTIQIVNGTLDLGGGVKATLNGSVSNITPKFKFKEGTNSDGFIFTVTGDASLSATVSGEFKGTKSKDIKIADAPVFDMGVACATVGIYATISASGEVTVSYSCGVMGGVDYSKKNGVRIIKDFQKKGFSFDSKVSEKAAIKISSKLYAGFVPVEAMKLGEIYIQVGESGTAASKKQDDGVICTSVKAYLFAEIGSSIEGILSPPPIKFIDEDNSPVKISMHFEDLKQVPKCSYGDTDAPTARRNTRRVRSTKFGSEFYGIMNDDGTYDKVSESDGSVTTITGETRLESNYTVYGDLIVNDTLYINDYTLNVKGNLIINPSGRLHMYGNESVVNISGDFITKSNVACSYGEGYNCYNYDGSIITVGGDLYQDNAEVNNLYMNGTDLKFVGSGTHVVSSACSNTYIPELSTDGNAELQFKGTFGDIKLVSDITIVDSVECNMNIYLNGHILNAKEDFIHEAGTIYVDDGTLNVEGSLTIASSGRLHMYGNESVVNISGDFITKSDAVCLYGIGYNCYNYDGSIITVGGDLYQDNAEVNNLYMNGTDLKFVGSGTHVVSSACSNTYIPELSTDGNAELQFKGTFGDIKLVSDITIVDSVECNMNIYLNGHILNAKEDFIYEAGTIYVDDGTLNVEGSLTIASSGRLHMYGNESVVNISGDFITRSDAVCSYGIGYNCYNYDGSTITVGGDLYQDNADVNDLYTSGTIFKFIAGGTHYVTCKNSNTKIDIVLAKGAKVNFKGVMAPSNTVKDESMTVTTPVTTKPVTTTTTKVTTTTKPVTTTTKPTGVKGDLNGDGKITVADIVALQKYLVKKSDTVSGNADLNGDGIVNVFDDVILRRMVMNK